MIEVCDVVSVLLCARASRRFGPGNKLLHPLLGKPLIAHAAGTLAAMALQRRVAVTSPDCPALDDALARLNHDVVPKPSPTADNQASLRIGIERAMTFSPKAVLVCLGDMPFASRAHLDMLFTMSTDEVSSFSGSASVRSPPCVLSNSMLRTLLAADVAMSIRRLADRSDHIAIVEVGYGELVDFDTKLDFHAWE